MKTIDKLRYMNDAKELILKYLKGELKIVTDALRVYDSTLSPLKDEDPDIMRIREFEVLKLRLQHKDLTHHIAVIELIVPAVPQNGQGNKGSQTRNQTRS